MVQRWEWSERLARFAAECRRHVQENENEDVLGWISWIERSAAANDPLGAGLEAARRRNAAGA